MRTDVDVNLTPNKRTKKNSGKQTRGWGEGVVGTWELVVKLMGEQSHLKVNYEELSQWCLGLKYCSLTEPV